MAAVAFYTTLLLAFVPVLYLSLIGFSFLTFLCRFSICRSYVCVCTHFAVALPKHTKKYIVILTDLWLQLYFFHFFSTYSVRPDYVHVCFGFEYYFPFITSSFVLSHSNALSVSLYRVSFSLYRHSRYFWWANGTSTRADERFTLNSLTQWRRSCTYVFGCAHALDVFFSPSSVLLKWNESN